MADDAPKLIFARLLKVMEELPEFEKQAVQGFKAFNIDDVYANVRPLLIRHGIVLIPQIVEITYHEGVVVSQGGAPAVDARVLVDYTLVCKDDASMVTVRGGAEGRDYQDKATNKALQQAIKYALINTLLIGTGEASAEEAIEGHAPVEAPPPAAHAAKAALVATFGKEAAIEKWNEARMDLQTALGPAEDDELATGAVMRVMTQIMAVGAEPAPVEETVEELTGSAAREKLINLINKKIPASGKDGIIADLRTMCRIAENLGYVKGDPDWLHVELAKAGLEHVTPMRVGEVKVFTEARQNDIKAAMGDEVAP